MQSAECRVGLFLDVASQLITTFVRLVYIESCTLTSMIQLVDLDVRGENNTIL